MNSQKFERELKRPIYCVREYGIQHLSFPRSELGHIRDDNAIAEEFVLCFITDNMIYLTISASNKTRGSIRSSVDYIRILWLFNSAAKFRKE